MSFITIPYADAIEAQLYFDGRLGTDCWDVASAGDKGIAQERIAWPPVQQLGARGRRLVRPPAAPERGLFLVQPVLGNHDDRILAGTQPGQLHDLLVPADVAVPADCGAIGHRPRRAAGLAISAPPPADLLPVLGNTAQGLFGGYG